MPHLNELSKKYKDQITFTAVNIWEERNPKDDSYIAKVEKYVKDFGDGMSFNVAADDPSGSIAKAWMEASKSPGIPTSFVVDGEGNIAWIGHPMGLDKPLEEMVAGTYDLAKAKAKKEAEVKAAAEFDALLAPFQEAMGKKDYKQAVAELDIVCEKKPEMINRVAMTKFNLMLEYDEPGAYAWAKEMSEGIYKDAAEPLNSIAWTIIDPEAKEKRKNPDVKLAIEIAERANKLSGDKDPMIMDTLATAYYAGGRKKDAIALQERAVALAEEDKGFTPAMLKDLKDRLAAWKAEK